MSNAAAKLTPIPKEKLRRGPGRVLACRITEEHGDVIVALDEYCERHKQKRNWVIAAALIDYLKANR